MAAARISQGLRFAERTTSTTMIGTRTTLETANDANVDRSMQTG